MKKAKRQKVRRGGVKERKKRAENSSRKEKGIHLLNCPLFKRPDNTSKSSVFSPLTFSSFFLCSLSDGMQSPILIKKKKGTVSPLPSLRKAQADEKSIPKLVFFRFLTVKKRRPQEILVGSLFPDVSSFVFNASNRQFPRANLSVLLFATIPPNVLRVLSVSSE